GLDRVQPLAHGAASVGVVAHLVGAADLAPALWGQLGLGYRHAGLGVVVELAAPSDSGDRVQAAVDLPAAVEVDDGVVVLCAAEPVVQLGAERIGGGQLSSVVRSAPDLSVERKHVK